MNPQNDEQPGKQGGEEVLTLPHEESLLSSLQTKKNNPPSLVVGTFAFGDKATNNYDGDQDIVLHLHEEYQEHGDQSPNSLLLSANMTHVPLNPNVSSTAHDEKIVQGVIQFPLKNGETTCSIKSITTGTVIPFKDDDIYEQTIQSLRDSLKIKSEEKQSSTSSLYSPKSCPICLGAYEVGDEIAWSKNEQCYHVYHLDCILGWLMERSECPMCRRDYLFCSNGDADNAV